MMRAAIDRDGAVDLATSLSAEAALPVAPRRATASAQNRLVDGAARRRPGRGERPIGRIDPRCILHLKSIAAAEPTRDVAERVGADRSGGL